MNLGLRPATSADQDFLARLYASTRAEEFAASGWPAATVAAFCAQQFAVQSQHYRSHFPEAECRIIERDGEPVGRLLMNHTDGNTHILDVSLLPVAQRVGLGTRLLTDVLNAAHQ